MNSQPKMDISVVIPAFNSEHTISELAHRIIRLFSTSKKNCNYEIIIVDDASNDGTWDAILLLKAKFQTIINGIQLRFNQGQHAATLNGMRLASGIIIITIDDDLQTPPEEILKLTDAYANSDANVIYGIYEQKKHSTLKNLGSRLLTYILKKFGNLHQRSSSFRLIDRMVVERLINVTTDFYFMEGLIPEFTDKIVYKKVTHLPRIIGRSNYSFNKMIFFFVKIIFEYTSLPRKIILISLPAMIIAIIASIAGELFHVEELSTFNLLFLSLAVLAFVLFLFVTIFSIKTKGQNTHDNFHSFKIAEII